MKFEKNAFTYSPTDLSGFLNCKALTYLNREAAWGNLKKPVYKNRVTMVLQERGISFEEAYLAELSESGKRILRIEAKDSQAAKKTIDGMRAGYDMIYQARLKMENWQGWADFLVRVETPSNLGGWSYEVLDTKLASETKAGTVLQIALYSEMIECIQGKMPEYMRVMTPGGETSFRVSDYMAFVRMAKRNFLTAMGSSQEVYPDVVGHCDVCNWWEDCNKRRRADDHLSFIAGMGSLHIKEVRNRNIGTLAAMARVLLPIPFVPSRGAVETYFRIREQARLQLQSREERRPIYELLPRIKDLGLARLPEPSKGDIYLDLEGDPMVESSGREYIIGWYYQGKYFIEWAETAAAEQQAFENFMDFATRTREQFPGMHIYHFGAYEQSAFKRIMCRYSTRENEMDGFLRSRTFIDLHSVVKQSLRAGVERYSLKDLERYHGFVRVMDLRKLSPVKADYEFLLEMNRLDQATAEMREVIRAYNQDDCVSTEYLHRWLERERAGLLAKGEIIDRPVPTNGDAGPKVTAHQERIKPLFDALIKDVPLEPTERNSEQQGSYILAHMLDWYRREEKSFWWEYFRLRELSDEDLLDEKLVLTGLKLVGKPAADKKSAICTYRFPSQECEIRRGDELQNREGKKAGEVVSIDASAGTIQVRKGPSMKDDHQETLFCLTIIKANSQEEAIIRLASWVVDNGLENKDPQYHCGRDLLLRNNPLTKKPFRNIDNSVDTATDWARKLEDSILPIQGPPGTGKSYTASRMILQLVKEKKRIGITALSHKVISNLLGKVNEEALATGTPIRILQKTSDQASAWETTEDNREMAAGIDDYDILAGTSFLWSRPEFHHAVDYLFVDEAGQLSLIDTLAVSHAGKNLVLLGDPQQLKQPQQGVHPDGTEVSALEHILQEHKTIGPEQGIFLSQTYRMHPEICAFDSELFYESKLHSEPKLKNQRLEGKTRFAGSGLFLETVDHWGNTSRSSEEVDRVAAIVSELTNGKVYWIDKENKMQKLTRNHIRIIAPYNAQVHELQDRIPNVDIGTVDKFQGQEAPVVIFSMTTSSPQDAPRGMDFLYSPNRFNVAVSRARGVFILVANPALLQAECRSPQQIKLANAFCRYWELARIGKP